MSDLFDLILIFLTMSIAEQVLKVTMFLLVLCQFTGEPFHLAMPNIPEFFAYLRGQAAAAVNVASLLWSMPNEWQGCTAFGSADCCNLGLRPPTDADAAKPRVP